MEKVREINGNVVVLVTIPKFMPMLQQPRLGEYSSRYIVKTTPCENINGKYFDLRTGEEVRKAANMLEWPVLSGVVFSYPKDNLLISRRYKDGKLLLLRLETREITPCMVINKVMRREVKEDF